LVFGSITEIANGDHYPARGLAAWVTQRGAALRAMGVRRGDRVLIAHGGSAAFFVDLMAVWHAGGCAGCLDPELTADELANIVRFVGPRLILGAKQVVGGFPNHPRFAPPSARISGSHTPGSLFGALAADDPALILFTSGTTGTPKGVVHSAGALGARLAANRRRIPPAALERTLCVLPTHFGHGLIGNCLTPLSAGGNLCLFTSPGLGGIGKMGALIDAHRIGFMSSVPAFWKIALRASPHPREGTLRRVHIGSAPLSGKLWRAVCGWTQGATVCNVYGITETANWVAGACSDEFEPEDGLVGPMWNGEARVRSDSGRVTGSGEGEILLRTAGQMLGYCRRDGLDPEPPRDAWYATGDRGRIDAGGAIRLTGRLKFEINRAGVKVLPEEVDRLVESHPEVVAACSFGLPDEVIGEMVAIAVQLRDSVLDPAQLAAWCAGRLRREWVP